MFRSIVVGTDGSGTAGRAVREAVDLAKATGATLELVGAYARSSEQRRRAERRDAPPEIQWAMNPRRETVASLMEAADLAHEQGVAANIHAREGDPSEVIIDVAEETKAELIILGNKGMTGAKRFLLGSVPDQVSHHAPCSVMIIRTS